LNSELVHVKENDLLLEDVVLRVVLAAFCARRVLACIRHHTSAYVSIRQHTSEYVRIRQHTSAYVRTLVRAVRACQHTSAYVSTLQHTSAYVSTRQHT
jgi:hypothetical protein